MAQKLILASTSPRRKELLKQIGFEFEIIPSDYEEDMTLKSPDKKLVQILALGKAQDVAKKLKEGIVIGIDTYVVYKKTRLGKPKNKDAAKRMLKMISGKEILVYSGIAIIDIKNKKTISDYELTRLKIKKLTSSEIEGYIKTGEPMDKAGAFAIQGKGAVFIEKIEGCYSNVVGMPISKVYKNLQKLGVRLY